MWTIKVAVEQEATSSTAAAHLCPSLYDVAELVLDRLDNGDQ